MKDTKNDISIDDDDERHFYPDAIQGTTEYMLWNK